MPIRKTNFRRQNSSGKKLTIIHYNIASEISFQTTLEMMLHYEKDETFSYGANTKTYSMTCCDYLIEKMFPQ